MNIKLQHAISFFRLWRRFKGSWNLDYSEPTYSMPIKEWESAVSIWQLKAIFNDEIADLPDALKPIDMKIKLYTEDQLSRRLRIHNRIAKRFREHSTVFQKQLSNTPSYNKLLEQLNRKAFVVREYCNVAAGSYSCEEKLLWTFQALLSRMVIIENSFESTRLRRLVKRSDLKAFHTPQISEKTINAAKKFVSYLEQDVPASEVPRILRSSLETIISEQRLPGGPTKHALNLSDLRKKRILIREVTVASPKDIIAKNSTLGRFPPDLLNSMLEFIDPRYSSDVRAIQSIQKNYDLEVAYSYKNNRAVVKRELAPFTEDVILIRSNARVVRRERHEFR